MTNENDIQTEKYSRPPYPEMSSGSHAAMAQEIAHLRAENRTLRTALLHILGYVGKDDYSDSVEVIQAIRRLTLRTVAEVSL